MPTSRHVLPVKGTAGRLPAVVIAVAVISPSAASLGRSAAAAAPAPIAAAAVPAGLRLRLWLPLVLPCWRLVRCGARSEPAPPRLPPAALSGWPLRWRAAALAMARCAALRCLLASLKGVHLPAARPRRQGCYLGRHLLRQLRRSSGGWLLARLLPCASHGCARSALGFLTAWAPPCCPARWRRPASGCAQCPAPP